MNQHPYGPQEPNDQRRDIPATFWVMLLLAALCLAIVVGLSGCQHPAKTASGPNLAGAVKRSQDITESITLAESDNKEIKRAIMSLQASNKVLRKLNGETVLILDRSDFKVRKLLEK